MKILVTGSSGQVGRHLSQALAKSPWHLTLLSHSDLDISCKQSVFKLIIDHSPDIIINAAAYTDVDQAEFQTALAHAVNSDGAGFLASAAKSIDAAIIHISTDYVFSGADEGTYKEEDPTAPVNAYGLTKRAGELAVMQANPKHIILRTSWVFSEHGDNFFQTMQRLALERDEITVVEDQFGGPTYAGNLAETIVKIIALYEQTRQLNWGTYHYCGHPYVSWFEFAKQIFASAPNPRPSPTIKPIRTADYKTASKRPPNSRLNCAKIHQTFGIPQCDWKSAIRRLTPVIAK